jgi:hypothetical protein
MDESTTVLQELHASVVRYLLRQGVKLSSPSVFGYDGVNADDDDDICTIVLELQEVLAAANETRMPVGGDCRTQTEALTRALDTLIPLLEPAKAALDALEAQIPTLGPVVTFFDQCALAKFKPNSRFEPPALKLMQQLAPRVHMTVDAAAQLRARLPDLISGLAHFEPAVAKLGFDANQWPTFFAYKLSKAGVALEVIADAIGLFDEISPRLPESDRLDERDRKVDSLRRRLNRFDEKLHA